MFWGGFLSRRIKCGKLRLPTCEEGRQVLLGGLGKGMGGAGRTSNWDKFCCHGAAARVRLAADVPLAGARLVADCARTESRKVGGPWESPAGFAWHASCNFHRSHFLIASITRPFKEPFSHSAARTL